MSEQKNLADVTTNVGTNLLFENEHIRVWDLRLKPGENIGLHRHEYRYAIVTLADGRLRGINPDGSTRFESDQVDGQVAYRALEESDVHDAMNVGDSDWRNLVIEFKDKPADPG